MGISVKIKIPVKNLLIFRCVSIIAFINKRPNIKNASGLFSSTKGKVDFVDLVVGSEGILGMVTSCILELAKKPNNYLELFLSLQNEDKAIDLHDYLYKYLMCLLCNQAQNRTRHGNKAMGIVQLR